MELVAATVEAAMAMVVEVVKALVMGTAEMEEG